MSIPWSQAIARLVAWLALGALIGWLYGQLLLGLWIATASYLGLTLVKLFRVERWLRRPRRRNAPDFRGVWGEVVADILRMRRRHQRRKKRVRRLLQQFRSSTGAMPDGAIVVNERREIAWFNGAAARLLGLQRSTDRGQRIDNLIRTPEFVEYLDRGDFSGRVLLPSPVDEALTLSFQIIPYGEGQQLTLVKDVTHQVHLERMRQDFVANASHELRSPLTVITGYLDTLSEDSAVPREWRKPLLEMHQQAHRMTAIIQDLLELSRLESPDARLPEGEVDIGGILALVRKEALGLERRPATIELHVESENGLSGSEAELHSAFANLVNNAVHFTPPEGRIDIRWWTDATGGHVSVADTGTGIPAEHLPRLTERFYRVDSGRARAEGGTGLGLAIVKHVLHRHQGQLEIESELGKGSTFYCHFPPERLVAAERRAAR